MERIVLRSLDGILESGHFEYTPAASASGSPANLSNEIQSIHTQLDRLRHQEERARIAYENEVYTLDEYKESKARLRSEIQRLVFISQDRLDSLYLQGSGKIDLFDPCMRMRAAQQFHDQAILGSNIIGVKRFSGKKSARTILSKKGGCSRISKTLEKRSKSAYFHAYGIVL